MLKASNVEVRGESESLSVFESTVVSPQLEGVGKTGTLSRLSRLDSVRDEFSFVIS